MTANAMKEPISWRTGVFVRYFFTASLYGGLLAMGIMSLKEHPIECWVMMSMVISGTAMALIKITANLWLHMKVYFLYTVWYFVLVGAYCGIIYDPEGSYCPPWTDLVRVAKIP